MHAHSCDFSYSLRFVFWVRKLLLCTPEFMIILRLHVRIFIPSWVSAWAEISARVAQTGLKLLSYNRVLCFIRILQQDRAESARTERNVIVKCQCAKKFLLRAMNEYWPAENNCDIFIYDRFLNGRLDYKWRLGGNLHRFSDDWRNSLKVVLFPSQCRICLKAWQ